jgi:hypothetical protein
MLLNDDLLVGRVKVRLGSELQEELIGLMRDPDYPDPDKPDAPPTEDPSCPNHCADAGLYSYRAAYHYVPREEKPRKLTREDGDEYEEMLVRKHLAEKQSNWYDEAPDDGGWQ